MERYEIIKELLSRLDESGKDIASLKKEMGISEPVLPTLLWLHEMGFVQSTVVSDRLKMISSKWMSTRQGKAYLEFIETQERPPGPEISSINLVRVRPKELDERKPGSKFLCLSDILEDLMTSATKEMLIASPYIDQTVVPLFKRINPGVRVMILTDVIENFLVRMQNENANMRVRTLREFRGGVQQYQIHAKFICVDEHLCFVGSSNLNERSIYYNFEVGILLENREIVRELKEEFMAIFNILGR